MTVHDTPRTALRAFRTMPPLLAAGLLWAAAPLWAQSAAPLSAPTAASLPPDAPIQTGTVSLYPSIELRVVGVDSNVFNESVDPRDDFSAEVSPRLVGAWRVGPALFVGSGLANASYYQTYKDEQSTNGQAAGRFELVSTRLRPFATAGYLRSRERTGYEIDERAQRVETAVSVGADFEVTAVTWLTGWALRSRLDYAQGERLFGVEIADELNHTTELAAAGLKFSLTPLTTLVVAAEFQKDRFDLAGLRDADSLRVTPAFEFAANAAINGRVAVGYREFRPLNPSIPDYRGFVLQADAAFTLLGMTAFQVAANRDVEYSVDPRAPYYLGAGGRVLAAQRIGGPFDIIGVGGWHRRRYQHPGGPSLNGRTETTTTLGGGVGVRFTIDLRLAMTYEYTQRDSSVPGERFYDRRRVLGVLNYGL